MTMVAGETVEQRCLQKARSEGVQHALYIGRQSLFVRGLLHSILLPLPSRDLRHCVLSLEPHNF
jgi:hypothetical protein